MSAHVVISLDVTPDGLGRRRHSGTATLSMVKPLGVAGTGAARGRRIASWPSLQTDLRNAGAQWVDQEVVVDNNLVSSRKPDDIPAFNREMIELFSHAGQVRQIV